MYKRRNTMRRIQLDKDVQPLSEFRANVASFIEKVRSTKRPLVITQRGKSAAVMLDVSEYEALLEKIELLTEIQVAESQIERGAGSGHDEAKLKVLERINK